MPEGGVSHRGAQMSGQGKRSVIINQLTEGEIIKEYPQHILMLMCVLYVLVFVLFLIFWYFAPLFYAAASHLLSARVRARRLSVHIGRYSH